MKIFKAKYVMLALVATTLISCGNDDTLKEADKAVAATSDFVIEPEMNYVIDGTLTYDHGDIKVAAAAAVNIHFDQPKNRVVISTTPKTFEVYKNSNQELKDRLAAANYKLTNDEVEKVQPSAGKYIPAGPPVSINAAFEDKALIGYSYTATGTSGDLIMGKFRSTSDSDMSTVSVFRIIHNSNGTIDTNWANITGFGFTTVYNSTSAFTNQRLMMDNESATTSLTKFFYQNINFGGTSYFYTTAANGISDLINLKNLNVKSFN